MKIIAHVEVSDFGVLSLIFPWGVEKVMARECTLGWRTDDPLAGSWELIEFESHRNCLNGGLITGRATFRHVSEYQQFSRAKEYIEEYLRQTQPHRELANRRIAVRYLDGQPPYKQADLESTPYTTSVVDSITREIQAILKKYVNIVTRKP